MADVFICYHEASAGELVSRIAKACEEIGVSCWYANRDIPHGADYMRRIAAQLRTCKVFLIILTAGTNTSIYVQNEIEYAIGRLRNGEDDFIVLPVKAEQYVMEDWVSLWLGTRHIAEIFNHTDENIKEFGSVNFPCA